MTRSGARLILASTAASCVGFLLCMPQPVAPRELPALVLDPAAVASAGAETEALAARAPHDAPSDRLRALIADAGTSAGGEALREALSAVRAAHGEAGLGALRAEAACRAEAALSDAPPNDETRRALGRFEPIATRYGLRRDGRRLAPPIVVRTLFEAQWNVIAGMAPTTGMSRTEEQAYWGWLALAAREAPVALRESALEAYAEVDGPGAEEAQAIVAYLNGDHADAFLRFKALYEATGELRLRNHAMAAEQHL
jgi:hypothetical protein